MCDVSLNKYDYKCRTDFISTLFSMLTENIYLDPSSAEFLINTIRHISLTDQRIEDYNKYALIMLHLENCVHPQKNDLKSSVEIGQILAGFPLVEKVLIKSKYQYINSLSESTARDLTQPGMYLEICAYKYTHSHTFIYTPTSVIFYILV